MIGPDKPDPTLLERSKACQSLEPAAPTQTDQEIQEIYNRYIDEYHCLIGLGYQPDPPPSVEVFTAGWRSHDHGPWSPIDGTGWQSWSQDQYNQARQKCTIEMLIR